MLQNKCANKSAELGSDHAGFGVSVLLHAVPWFPLALGTSGLSWNLDPLLTKTVTTQWDQADICKDQKTPVISSTSSSIETALCQT